MTTVKLNLPNGAIQKGQLYDEYSIEDLDQDIIEIELQSGVTIEAGWYPEYDRSGRFQITAFRDFWENRLMTVTVKNAAQLITCIEALAAAYSLAPVNPIAGSTIVYSNISTKSESFPIAVS